MTKFLLSAFGSLLGLGIGGFSCGATQAIYYVEPGGFDTVGRLTLDPDIATGTHEFLAPTPVDPRGLAVDEINGKIYYGDGFSIARSNLDGTDIETVLTLSKGPGDIEVDPIAGKIYFSDLFGGGNAIRSANLDGTGVTTILDASILSGQMADPSITVTDVLNIEIDTDADLIYWTADSGTASAGSLNRASLDGSGATELFSLAGSDFAISRMDIDFDETQIYYSVGGATNEIRRSQLDGSGVETLVSGVGRPLGMAIDADEDLLVFAAGSAPNAGIFYQASLDGTGLVSRSINTSTSFSVFDIEIASTTAIPEPSSLGLMATATLALIVTGQSRRRSLTTRLRGRG